jgi:molybdate transport system substrate-binding protein
VRRPPAPGALVLAAALLAACSGSGDTAATPRGEGSPSGSAKITGTITVLAAASLQESFTTLGQEFESAHPGSKVVFSFGPSSGLAEQIAQGSPADVFASASTATMDEVVTGGDAADPRDFAVNEMEIVVPKDNPAGIATVRDLAKDDVKVALCQAQVPCGATALEVFDNAGITVTPVTEELDVKATLSKVTLGEVDAGVVDVTDARAARDTVLGIEIPDDVNASTTYPIATLRGSENPATAQAFVDFVLAPDGTRALAAAGFSAP